MDILNLHVAGIDIWRKSNYVAVREKLEYIKQIGVYTDDITDICLHLKNIKLFLL